MSSTWYHSPFLLFASAQQVLGAFPCFHCMFPCQRDLHPDCGAAPFWSKPHSSSFPLIHCLWVTKDRFALGRGRNDCTATEFSRMCCLTLLSPAKFLVIVDFLSNCFWWCRLRGSVIFFHTLLVLAVTQRCDYCKWRCPAQNSAWASSQEKGCQRQSWDHPFPCSWEEGEEIHGEQKEWEKGKVYQGPDVQKGKNRAGTDSVSPSAIISW